VIRSNDIASLSKVLKLCRVYNTIHSRNQEIYVSDIYIMYNIYIMADQFH